MWCYRGEGLVIPTIQFADLFPLWAAEATSGPHTMPPLLKCWFHVAHRCMEALMAPWSSWAPPICNLPLRTRPWARLKEGRPCPSLWLIGALFTGALFTGAWVWRLWMGACLLPFFFFSFLRAWAHRDRRPSLSSFSFCFFFFWWKGLLWCREKRERIWWINQNKTGTKIITWMRILCREKK